MKNKNSNNNNNNNIDNKNDADDNNNYGWYWTITPSDYDLCLWNSFGTRWLEEREHTLSSLRGSEKS